MPGNLCSATPRTLATGEFECPNCGTTWEKSEGDRCPNAPKSSWEVTEPTPVGKSIDDLINEGYLPPLADSSRAAIFAELASAAATKTSFVPVDPLKVVVVDPTFGELNALYGSESARVAMIRGGQVLTDVTKVRMAKTSEFREVESPELEAVIEDAQRYRRLVEMLKVGAVMLPHGPRAEEHLKELLG